MIVPSHTSVLIVGGSLNGLSAALMLAQRGVACVVVERHARTSIQYKFRGISPRSMEIYRSLGIEAEIRARDLIDDKRAYVARMKNLADSQVSWQGIPWSDTSDISPTGAATCDQDQLEPILRAHAERLGADVRFNTELVDLTQDAQVVSARVRNRSSGVEDVVAAKYLIAADGSHSQVRDALAIARHGPGVLQHWMNVIFETDWPATIDGRPLRSVFVTDINGTFVPRGDGRWLMAVQYVPERGERPEDFTGDRCADLIRRGAGRPDINDVKDVKDVKVDIVDARPWEAAASVADRYVDGRVFLVGDSAHVMPPTGGFGGNTGIQDAHNLAWKLDMVLRGAAGPRLLDTYDQERRPIADGTMAQALARLQAWFKDPGRRLPAPEPIVDDNAVIFGYRYPAGAFVADNVDANASLFENPRTPSGRPGSRAPQVTLDHEGHAISSIDLFAGQWVMCARPQGRRWLDAAASHDAAHAFLLVCHQLTAGDLRGWTSAFKVGEEGAVLIRPDGFIAWRAHEGGSDRLREFERTLDTLRFLS